MTPDWQDTLTELGYLSVAQLAQWFGLTLSEIEPSSYILYQDALWLPDRFGQGRHRRHREATTEAFLALSPYIQSWQKSAQKSAPIPDGVLTVPDDPHQYWVEIDTGSESARQWRDKLAQYQGISTTVRLLVIAVGGHTRLERLHRWLLKASPIAWMLLSSNDLGPPPWPVHTPHRPPLVSNPPPREVVYEFQGHPVSSDEAEAGLASGRFRRGARQIHHLKDIIQLL